MPANREHDTVTLEVRAEDLDSLRMKALRLAAEFFGVDPDHAELRAGAIRAEVTYYDHDNVPQGYKSSITVRLLTADDMRAEGSEPSEP